ncbi:alpha/beta hydrolase fold domain-containing protein [Novipirellula caenicola]|uniref:Carboxylesterase NlhH n=1 Tax=Novipirellula caenicola TaxID=1536901 RepID=A0ABP9VQY9_9BACT
MMNHRRYFLTILCLALTGIGTSTSHAQTASQETSPQFKRLDRNRDGKLTDDEFSGPLFRRIDTNQDGVISVAEDQAFTRRAGRGPAAAVTTSVQAELDLPYAGTDNPRQTLDLYLPKTRKDDKPLPVVVFIHGGGWQNGDKKGGYGPLAPLVESGQYIGVSVGYRLSGEAIWPAQIHDCKAAIRWLRGNAKRYNLDPDKIGVTGTSAGGHLVAMLGTTGDVPELEGQLGDHLSHSSSVNCVVDQYGPTDLLSMGGWHDDANSPESKLVGGTLQENPKAARNASPITYVSKNDSPFLIIHGTDDRVVPLDQSEQLHEALSKVGVESMLVPVQGGGHGRFSSPEVAKRLKQFFDKHLLGKEVTISSEPIPQRSNNPK